MIFIGGRGGFQQSYGPPDTVHGSSSPSLFYTFFTQGYCLLHINKLTKRV
jgi:hypothetical protein